MRRVRATVISLAASAFVLSGCSDGSTSPAPPSADDAAQSTGPDPQASSADTDDAAATSAPAQDDQAAATDVAVEGGVEGQAAAEVAKEFFSAMVAADPKACDYLLSFTDVEVPMTEVESDYETCQTLLPPILEEEVKAQGLDEEGAAIIEAMTITGADVHSDGTTAVVDKDNFSTLFAESMGSEVITLKKLGEQWYIDLDHSFTPTSGQ